MTEKSYFPRIRFNKYRDSWKEHQINNVMDKVAIPVEVKPRSLYREIGIRSHGKGIFYKEPVYGASLGNKRIFQVVPECFVVNIVFAWELAIAKTHIFDKDLVASHRFPMFKPKEKLLDLDFILYKFLTKKGKRLLELASPGGAGRNKTLGQKAFNEIKLLLPTIEEQKDIAHFLSAIDRLIDNTKEQEFKLSLYKKGILQNIFSGNLKFCKENNNKSTWKEIPLKDIMHEHRLRSTGKEEVFSVSVKKGLVNQIDHLGRSYAAKDRSKYRIVKPGDLVYTKSPTGEFPYGIVKQNQNICNVIVSPLYGVFTPINHYLGYIVECFFESSINMNNYLKPIVKKGAKNTINITNERFLSRPLYLPTDTTEQKEIAIFIKHLSDLVSIKQQQLKILENWRDWINQEMFV